MVTKKTSGRDREVLKIVKANMASAVGRLMLGEFNDWKEFISYESCYEYVANLPRKNIKSGVKDIQKRLNREIKKFCEKNFDKMDDLTLASLFVPIAEKRGMEIPLKEFEEMLDVKVKSKALRDAPSHATVVISLWGLKFQFPEHELSNDIIEAMKACQEAEKKLKKFKKNTLPENKEKVKQIQDQIRILKFSSRSCILSCFNLLEAYLNGIGWSYLRDEEIQISNKKRKMLEGEDGSFFVRLKEVPKIITGSELWHADDEDLENIKGLKPFRDSLVHPSPFSAKEKFGGYDKLKNLYLVNLNTARKAVSITVKIIFRLNQHLDEGKKIPKWLEDLSLLTEDVKGFG